MTMPSNYLVPSNELPRELISKGQGCPTSSDSPIAGLQLALASAFNTLYRVTDDWDMCVWGGVVLCEYHIACVINDCRFHFHAPK